MFSVPTSRHPRWARVTHNRAETRGQGYPMAQWDGHDGEFKHYPGHDVDMMYFAVPLRGDFQVDCELNSGEGRKIRVIYGGAGVSPGTDPQQLERFQLGGASTDLVVSPPLAKLGDWYAFRLIAKENHVEAFVNGRSVYNRAISADGDPWLALVCQGTETGAARGDQDLRKTEDSRKAQAFGTSRTWPAGSPTNTAR